MKLFTPFSSLPLLFFTFFLCDYLGPSGCRALPFSGARQADIAVQKGHGVESSSCEKDPECLLRLFEQLEEASRIADIAYCVPAPGIYKPFQCAGRCREFQGFELVKVRFTSLVLSTCFRI